MIFSITLSLALRLLLFSASSFSSASIGFQDTVDAVIMVYAPVELRIQRAMYRDGASEEQVRARIAAQMDDEEKRRRADFTVVNDGVQLLIPQLNRIVEQLKTEKFIL